MKILVLTSRFPYPIEKGDKLRIYHQIRTLSQDHEVVLCALHDRPISEAAKEEMGCYCSQIYTFPLHRIPLYWRLITAPFRGLPWMVAYFNQRSIGRRSRLFWKRNNPIRFIVN